jgi:hypothetical protein
MTGYGGAKHGTHKKSLFNRLAEEAPGCRLSAESVHSPASSDFTYHRQKLAQYARRPGVTVKLKEVETIVKSEPAR